ncbi:homologous recombination OB-fold protein isoform X2 [Pseudoliparis swirei]|uniref:homologous recombination OB-fold protein isoform X2 n=1 Tax=Pseudoliparis swirei TaxID=2059687 RepID=UPI0024BDD058|nr:homologous recombination OB-fold protein isoform X2 [Pseudoliparis swirei]
MTCKLSGLFSIGEDFDDEDLLGTDWAAGSSSGPAVVPAAVASCSLRASSVSLRGPETNCLQPAGERSAARCHGAASQSESTHTAAGQTAPGQGLRRPSSASSAQPLPPAPDASRPNLALQRSPAVTEGPPEPAAARDDFDDFDDWDVDLADLDECDRQTAPPPARGPPASSCKTLRPPNCGAVQTRPDRPPRDFGTARQASGSFGHKLPSQASSTPLLRSPNPRPAHLSAPPPSPGVFPGLTASSPGPGPISRTIARPRRSWATPGPSPRGRALFETVSPAPSSSPSLSPHPLHTPVFTNRLVQLVSASNKLPSKRPRSEPHQPRTRRFPGPAGFLPQQPQGQNLDDIVVSVPQTPAHGVVARSPSQVSSSQTDEDEFCAGGWAAMKAEMGLDERNPSCFLHSYSVVMVLRKAALKQLAKNKVPNMAVLLKSIIHTHADAKAVFRDPTGEIQGTVHRRLLEDRAEELKVGSVLLLKQVGVFSPSHRNHYLNVTPNNLLRIYAPDGVGLSSTRLPPPLLEPMSQAGSPPAVLQGTVSRMQLVFDEEDDEGGEHPKAPSDTRAGSGKGPQEHAGSPAPLDAGWDADDDLDELLGELPEESYIL